MADAELAWTVHPHAGGEHDYSVLDENFADGSPPRRWGTRDKCGLQNPAGRFTPTQVGNTIDPSHIVEIKTVHPHAGGEHPSPRVSIAK